jgi:hypothetical protein
MSTTPGTVTDVRSAFRQAVTADAADIRELKPRVRSEQRAQSDKASAMQSRLARLRRAARARHVAYSLWRGRCWMEIENNRPDGDPTLSYAVAEAWSSAAVAAAYTGPVPESLRVHIEKWL